MTAAVMQNKAEKSSAVVPTALLLQILPAQKEANRPEENISRLQTRIEEVKGNDEMRPGLKGRPAKTMIKQLAV